MAKHNETGKTGEKKAVELLKKKGYKIISTNWRYKHLEIDIIAEHEDYLAIVEVKTRSRLDFGQPESFVSKAKQQKLIKAADYYGHTYSIKKDILFDIIAVKMKPKIEIKHIVNAFYP